MSGIAAFATLTLISYLLILIHGLYLIIPIVIIGVILAAKSFIKIVKSIRVKFDLTAIITILVFVVGIAGQLAVISPSGTFDKAGDLLFWSSNGHDGSWHIALMNEIKRGWPFQNPVLAGEKLVNYHFFSDILPAVVSKYTPVNNIDLYFRIFPFIYSLFFGVSAYFLIKKADGEKSAAIWSTIFSYFAGSFGFIVTYLKNRTIGGESIFWASQPQSASGNSPQIASDFLIFTALYFLISLEREKDKKKRNILFIICIILFGTLVSFKVYAGIIALISLGIYSLWKFFRKKDITLIFLTIISGALSVFLYFPNASNSTSFLIFQPWWYIRTMVVEPSRLNWLDLELRREFYVAHGGIKSILRVIEYEGIAFLIFFFGNLGMRFLGLRQYLKTHLFIKVAIALSIIFPLLFLQNGIASNTIQFLQYFLLFFGILAGIEVSKLTSKYKLLIPMIILLMIPTQVGLLYEFYSRPAYAMISAQELQAINFLKKDTPQNSVILTPPYNPYLNLGGDTPNIWDWFDTSYLAAFSDRRTFMDDYEQVDIMGYNWKPRLDIKTTVFSDKNINEVKSAFEKSSANILYYPKAMKPVVDPSKIGLKLIFENEDVEIWK